MTKKRDNTAEQAKLFVCEYTNWPAKDDLASMDVPIFSLSKNGDTKIRKFIRGNRSTTIIPSSVGAATVFDKDLLIYAASQIIEAKNQGKPVSRTVRVESYDFLVATERSDGGAAFDNIIDMLRRLKGTNIESSVPTGGIVQTQSFSLIEDYKIISEKKRTTVQSKVGKLSKVKETNKVLSFEFVLSEWLMNGLLNFEVLTLDHGYFKLSKPVEKRLYEIGRKHCGAQATYKENIDDFAEKVGLKGPRYKVRAMLKEIIRRDPLPEYHIALDETKALDDVVFYSRNTVLVSRHLIAHDLLTWYNELFRHDNCATSSKTAPQTPLNI